MTNENDATETKIERSLFTQVCHRCNKEIKGTSRKQLKHTFGMHLLYCQNTKQNETKG